MRWIWVVFLALLGGCAASGARSFDVVFAGDTAFGESYQDARRRRGLSARLYERGADAMIAPFARLLRRADVVVVNLETPLTTERQSPLGGVKRWIHYGRPDETTAALARHGVTIASLGNNHAFDFGAAGLTTTNAALIDAGITPCGAGADAEVAGAPRVRAAPSGRALIAVACAFEPRQQYADRYDWYAGPATPGVAALDPAAMAARLGVLKADDPALVTVAFVHWGANYDWARERQRDAARALAAAGVDMVIGHGAHHVQEVERIGQTWVAYGLGNFVFGSPGRTEAMGAPPYSVVARVRIRPDDPSDLAIRLYPIVTDNKRTDYRPRPVTRAEFADVIALLGVHSPDVMAAAETGRDRYGRFIDLAAP